MVAQCDGWERKRCIVGDVHIHSPWVLVILDETSNKQVTECTHSSQPGQEPDHTERNGFMILDDTSNEQVTECTHSSQPGQEPDHTERNGFMISSTNLLSTAYPSTSQITALGQHTPLEQINLTNEINLIKTIWAPYDKPRTLHCFDWFVHYDD